MSNEVIPCVVTKETDVMIDAYLKRDKKEEKFVINYHFNSKYFYG